MAILQNIGIYAYVHDSFNDKVNCTEISECWYVMVEVQVEVRQGIKV